jgi:hypothetical protein
MNFGQIGDLRGKSLSINGKLICDSKRNIYARNLYAKTVTIDGQSVIQSGGVLNAPILTNVPGIARVGVQYGTKLTNPNSTQLMYANTWGVNFESTVSGVSLIQQNNHLFQPPTTIPHLPNFSSMIVESEAHFTMVCIGFAAEAFSEYIEIDLLKNGEIVSSALLEPGNAYIHLDQIVLHDITICNAGDSLDYQITQQTSEGSVFISAGNDLSWATFKVLDFQNVSI